MISTGSADRAHPWSHVPASSSRERDVVPSRELAAMRATTRTGEVLKDERNERRCTRDPSHGSSPDRREFRGGVALPGHRCHHHEARRGSACGRWIYIRRRRIKVDCSSNWEMHGDRIGAADGHVYQWPFEEDRVGAGSGRDHVYCRDGNGNGNGSGPRQFALGDEVGNGSDEGTVLSKGEVVIGSKGGLI
nr:hypothetical protein CFP56_66141 [Quercus suber]